MNGLKTKVAYAVGVALASSLLLVGCNGGGSSSSSSDEVSSTYSVRAIDGYLSNAKVWLDITPDFIHDPDTEPSAITQQDGVAKLDVTGIESPELSSVVVSAIAGQTIDQSYPNQTIGKGFTMSAPSGRSNITPLSTLVHVTMLQSKLGARALSEEEAIELVAAQLGITKEEVLGDFIARAIENDQEPSESDVVFAAENIVASQALSMSGEELRVLVNTTQEDSTFDEKLSVVTDKIKSAIDADIIDVPVFLPDDDFEKDSDGDTIPDIYDEFPDDASEWADFDGDGEGDEADLDDDNDDVNDVEDHFPTNPNLAGDHDDDGVDTLIDAFPNDKSEWEDSDKDGYGNNQDLFDDDPLEWADSDEDGYGDNQDLFDDDPIRWSNNDIVECVTGDTPWNEATALPVYNATFEQFIQASQACNYHPMTDNMLTSELNIYQLNYKDILKQWSIQVNSSAQFIEGEYPDSDWTWSITEAGYLALQSIDSTNEIYFALLGSNENDIAFKIYFSGSTGGEQYSEVYYEDFTFTKPESFNLVSCPFAENGNDPTLAQFEQAITDCGGIGIPVGEEVDFSTTAKQVRINSMGETRAYQYEDANMLTVFKRGENRGYEGREWFWDETNRVVVQYDRGSENSTVILSTIVWVPLKYQAGSEEILEQSSWIQYEEYLDEDTGETHTHMFSFVSREIEPTDIVACTDDNSQFDDNEQLISTPRNYADFLMIAEDCRISIDGRTLKLTRDMLENSTWYLGDGLADPEPEEFVFTENTFVSNGEGSGSWSIDDGVLYVTDNNGDSLTVIISDSDGHAFSTKGWWRTTEYGIGDSGDNSTDVGIVESAIMWRKE